MWQSSGVRTVALSFTTSDSCWGFYLRMVAVRRLQQGSCSRAYACARGSFGKRSNIAQDRKRLQSKQTIYVPTRSYLEPIRWANEMLLGLGSEWALQTVRARARRREERGRVKSLRPHGGTPNVSTQINANPQKRDKHRLPFVADQYFCLFDSTLKPLIAW
jgi:hypothetical protein